MIFDCFGYWVNFIEVGKFILEWGRVILVVIEKLVNDVMLLVNGWEFDIMIVLDGIVFVVNFFFMVEVLGNISKMWVCI